ncbi:hypothetical protein [Bifidobacterium sp. B4142]|uniref:hypothetical protein n=1 Tax=Bifidobacterium sp. B4142 TaxID=2817962 RepID=UPI00226B7CFE|nr:hypothetical protein [Bifidobacterium sp. B4142]MCX8687423.1 hypothetical protein [Bifidobacterium sp. B4142]
MTSTRARQAIQHSESMAQPIFDKKKKRTYRKSTKPKTKASTKTHPTIRLSTIEQDASNTRRNVFQKQHAQKRSSRLFSKYPLAKELN